MWMLRDSEGAPSTSVNADRKSTTFREKNCWTMYNSALRLLSITNFIVGTVFLNYNGFLFLKVSRDSTVNGLLNSQKGNCS